MSAIHSAIHRNARLLICLLAVSVPAYAAKPQPLETITVTATRLLRAPDEIAGTVTLISSAEIEQQVSDDLDDLIRYQPGITMDTAGRGGNQGFVIRGMGGNRVLTLIDGVRSNDIYDAVVSGYGRDVYEIDDLKAVEIIRGPASVHYGADAMGGAVILRTRDPADYLAAEDSFHAGIRASAASADEQYKAGFTAAGQYGDLGALIQYTRREFHEQEILGGGELNPLRGHSDNIFAKAAWSAHVDHRLVLTFDGVRNASKSNLLSDLSTTVSSSIGDDKTERYRVSLAHGWQLVTPLMDRLDSQIYWQRTDGLQHSEQRRKSYSFVNPANPSTFGGTTADRISDFGFNQEIQGVGMTLSKNFETGSIRHAMVYGFSIDQTLTDRPRQRCDTAIDTGMQSCAIAAFLFAQPEVFPNKTFPDTTTTRAGVYGQDEVVVGDSGLTLIPGLRYDVYAMDPEIDGLLDVSALGYDVVSVEEDELSLNLGALYEINANFSLFAQYSQGFRPPNYDEANQAYVNRTYGYGTVPNPDLAPETSQGVELGIRANFNDVNLSMALYDNRYEDFIDSQFIAVVNGIRLYQDRNISEARIYGAEATATWQITDHWRLRGSLAYAHGDDEEAGMPLDTIDPLNGVMGLRYDAADDRWGVEAILTLVDGKDRVSADDRVRADGYGLLDLTGHLRFTDNVILRAGVFNLLDTQYARWSNLQGLAAADGVAIARAQEPGINFRVGMNVDF